MTEPAMVSWRVNGKNFGKVHIRRSSDVTLCGAHPPKWAIPTEGGVAIGDVCTVCLTVLSQEAVSTEENHAQA